MKSGTYDGRAQNRSRFFKFAPDGNRPVMLIPLALAMAMLMQACSGNPKITHSSRKGAASGVQLLVDKQGGNVPVDVSLTARVPANMIPNDPTEKVILLWVVDYPGGMQYRAREEVSLMSLGESQPEYYFYRSYSLDQPGRFGFYLTLFPDDSSKRIYSNRVSVLCHQPGVQ